MTGEIREHMAVVREQFTRESSIVAFIISNRMFKHDMRLFILIQNDLLLFSYSSLHCVLGGKRLGDV